MKTITLFLVLAFGGVFAARGQVSITGPLCALPGVQYQYLITTRDTTGSGIHICLTGGTYSSGGTCLNDSLVSSVLVVWNAGITSAVISFSSNAGTATDTVYLTNPMQPGTIDSSTQQQTVGYDSSFSSITCSVATGGNCSPSYAYQWQQSADNLVWTDIDNATGKDLTSGIVLTQTSYFRRKVTETVSGTIGYSNAATITVTYPSGSAKLDRNQHILVPGAAAQYKDLYCKTAATTTSNL